MGRDRAFGLTFFFLPNIKKKKKIINLFFIYKVCAHGLKKKNVTANNAIKTKKLLSL